MSLSLCLSPNLSLLLLRLLLQIPSLISQRGKRSRFIFLLPRRIFTRTVWREAFSWTRSFPLCPNLLLFPRCLHPLPQCSATLFPQWKSLYSSPRPRQISSRTIFLRQLLWTNPRLLSRNPLLSLLQQWNLPLLPLHTWQYAKKSLLKFPRLRQQYLRIA